MGGLPIGDTLGEIVETYRDRAVDLLALSALRTVVTMALTLAVLWALFGPVALDLFGSGSAGAFAGFGAVDPAGSDEAAGVGLPPDLPVGLIELMLILSAVGGLVALVVVVLDGAMVARAHGGTDVGPDLGTALRQGLARFGPLFGAALVIQLLVLVLFAVPLAVFVDGFAAVAPALEAGDPSAVPDEAVTRMGAGLIGMLVGGVIALFLYVALFLFIPAAVVDDEGALSALRRSWALTRGHRLKLFLLIVVVALIAGLVSMALVTPVLGILGPGASPLVVQVPAAIAATLVGPLFPLLAQVVHARLAAEPLSGPIPPGGDDAEYVPLDA